MKFPSLSPACQASGQSLLLPGVGEGLCILTGLVAPAVLPSDLGFEPHHQGLARVETPRVHVQVLPVAPCKQPSPRLPTLSRGYTPGVSPALLGGRLGRGPVQELAGELGGFEVGAFQGPGSWTVVQRGACGLWMGVFLWPPF